MSPAEQQEKNQPQVLRGGAGNVDKIRDILFGVPDARLRVQIRASGGNPDQRNTRNTRHQSPPFRSAESYIKREFETVQTRFKSERDERSDTTAQQSRELKELGDLSSRRLRDLDDRGTTVERDLRSDLLQQARELTEEIRARHDEIAGMMEKRVNELRDGKTDRAALATLFTEVALRLSDQFQIPGSEE